MPSTSCDPAPTSSAAHRVSPDLTVRLLGLHVGPGDNETYSVSFRPTVGAPFRSGLMTHAQGRSWDLVEEGSLHRTAVTWGSPDEVFRLALGAEPQHVSPAMVAAAAPHWPTTRTARLASRRLMGRGTVAFDASWFLSRLTTSALDRPLVFPDATRKLKLTGLTRANAIVRALAANVHHPALVPALLDATRRSREQTTEGRLIGESTAGDLEQLGSNLEEGCQAAIGTRALRVVFDPSEPLGLGLGPLWPSDCSANRAGHEDLNSVGRGAVVGEVDPGSAAERAGITVGMALSRMSPPKLLLPSHGAAGLCFEDVLDEIDERRADSGPLTITFDTAAPVTHHYAVEMAAAAMLTALATVLDIPAVPWSPDPGVRASLDALCGPALLWREDTPRLFLGEAGSVTSAHIDICPQLQVAHGLFGTKFLAAASQEASSRLAAEYANDEGPHGEEPTFVSTDRPLTPRQARLLAEPDVTMALLLEGDLAVFDSGALHFASNGANGLTGALYHGLMTSAAVPRLRLAAAKSGGSHAGSNDAYQDHLYAADLLRMVE